MLDRPFAEEELLGDLGIGQALAQQLQDVLLAGAERGFRCRCWLVLDQDRRGIGRWCSEIDGKCSSDRVDNWDGAAGRPELVRCGGIRDWRQRLQAMGLD